MEETTPLQQLDLGCCYTPACQYGYCGDKGLRFIHGFLPSNFGQEVPKCPRPNIGPRANSVVRVQHGRPELYSYKPSLIIVTSIVYAPVWCLFPSFRAELW